MMEEIRSMYLDAQRQFTRATTKETEEYWRGKVDAYYSVYTLSQADTWTRNDIPKYHINVQPCGEVTQ